nr:hypothetical protein GCM10025699_68800 [Microbacterium flavescens]
MSVQARKADMDAPDGPYTAEGTEAFYGEVKPPKMTRARSRSGWHAIYEGKALLGTSTSQTAPRVLIPTDPSEGFRAADEPKV